MDKELSKLMCKYVTSTNTTIERVDAVRELRATVAVIESIQGIIEGYSTHEDEAIINVLLDDNGQCIHIHLSNWINTNIINKIGKLFGDDNVAVTITKNYPNCITLIVINKNKRFYL
jgi:hypothetical protein